MTPAAIRALGLAPLATALRDGSVTSRAATEAVLAGLDGPGRALNAVARLHRDEALAEAERCDAERARGHLRGPLHGVPLAHKDMFHRAGRLSEMGSALGRGFVPDTTATVLERLDAAGAIDVGRLAMVEFALGITGHNRHAGHPMNAWDGTRITGGSTSGGATALAARLLPATLGSDTGGSIRAPASLCGVVGLKPTYGCVSRAGAMPLSYSLDHVGPLARSAEDVGLMLQVLAGHDPLDPTTSARPAPAWQPEPGRGLEGVRILLPRDCFEMPVEPSVEAAWMLAGDVLRQLGARVEERRLPSFTPLGALRRLVMTVEIAAVHREQVRTRPDAYNGSTLSRMLLGFALEGADYVRALAARGTVTRSFCREAFGQADVLALPTVPCVAPTIAEIDTDGAGPYVAASNLLGSLVGPFNYLGLPALSTPMGFDGNGVPLGLQLVARPFAEPLLLRVADAFEQATGWLQRRPPLA